MARIDLNIVDRGVTGTEWVAADVCLQPDHVDKIMEQRTDNSCALNSLPTPFARFFVAREAFRRLAEEHIDSSREAGFAYRQLVSDILDVYELLFQLKYHENAWGDSKKIELREWNSRENMTSISRNMPVLYKSIEEFYKTDIKEEKLYFLVYTEKGREILLACSSPLTGFVTPPDLDKAISSDNRLVFGSPVYDNLTIPRKSGGRYFRDIKLFEDRDQDFKNYMYNELFGSDKVDIRFKYIKEYIKSFKTDLDIQVDYSLKLESVMTDQNNSLVVNGLEIKYSDEVDIYNCFTQSIIKLPYRIDRDRYKTVIYDNDVNNRDYDFLLPLKPESLELFGGDSVDAVLHINRNSVTVALNYCGKEYKKEYAVNPSNPDIGRIYDMKAARTNFNLGIFPNILSPNDSENNYFKVLLVASDEDSQAPNLHIDEINLSFYKEGQQIAEINHAMTDASFGVLPAVVRSRQKSPSVEGGTKFYELFNTSFTVVQLSVKDIDSGLVIPVLDRSAPSGESYTYAIDLGTSNTFMSRCRNTANGTPDLSKKPELFTMEAQMVSYMHESSANGQLPLSKRVEESIFESAKDKIKTEFVPAVIEGKAYSFPIRTALCGIRNKSDEPELFDNHNIAFFYEKKMANDDQIISTDIKWQENEALLRVFIRELLLIIKCDILQRHGDLQHTHLVWFRPLSFMGDIRTMYIQLWNDEAKKILKISHDQVYCYSESEAPYYYFKHNNNIKDSAAVAVIDIGGGSTDFVYFKDNMPQIANSVHFGCDVLWGNGFNSFANVRENGIYKKYANTLRFKKRPDLDELNTSFIRVDGATTKDIINFWIGNSEYCDIMKLMSQEFKPVFVYHLTSILFYMASMFKDNGLEAPKTVVFSGNGSKYIDNLVSSERRPLNKIVTLVFSQVFGGEHNVKLELPEERKESTCYGGLYRDSDSPDVREVVYQGTKSAVCKTIKEVNENYDVLKTSLLGKYSDLNSLYKEVLEMLKEERIIGNTADTRRYVEAANLDMGVPLDTYYTSQIQEKYKNNGDVTLYESVFFLPVIDRIFTMTNL